MFIGYKTQWDFLKKTAKNQRIPHAMLFSGLEHLGKKTIALEFIRSLNCENVQENYFSCRKCSSCSEIEKFIYPDFYFIEPTKKEIQIDEIRALQNFLFTTPSKSNFKAVLINDAHRLNRDSQNCLLKTLEEPKGKVILIFISSQADTLLPTLRSRCQRLNFYPLEFSEIEAHFKEKANPELLKKLILFSEGRPGITFNFFKNPEELDSKIKKYQTIKELLEADLEKRFLLIRKITQSENFTENFEEILENIVKYLRALLLKKIGINENYFGSFFETSFLIKNYSLQNIKDAIKNIEKLRELTFWANINQKLALENFIINL